MFLDVACGPGGFLHVLERLGGHGVGVDLSRAGLNVAQRMVKAPLVQCVAETLPTRDSSFDVITCFGSIEHFVDIPRALNEMKRVAKARARYVFLVPNANYVFGSGTNQPRELLLGLREWRQMFESMGFEILHVFRDNHPRYYTRVLSDRKPINIVKRLIFILLWAIMPLYYTCQFVFVARLPEPTA